MTTKIDISAIIKEHIESLRDDGADRVSLWDLGVMFGAPLVLSIAAFVCGFKVADDQVGTLVGAFSIFAGFLFNVIVLIYGFDPPEKGSDDSDDQRKLLSQTFANISYSVLISITIVVTLLMSLFARGSFETVFSALFVLLAANFGLSLLMVLKRIYVLLGLKFPK